MLRDSQSSDVRLLIGYTKVLSMESDKIVLKYVLAINVTFICLFISCLQFFAQSGLQSSSKPQLTALLGRLFHRSPSNIHDTSPSSPLDWARNILSSKPFGRGQSCEGTKLQGRSPVAVVKVLYVKAKFVCSFSLSDVQLHLISRREMFT
jgi:hypothetical protein